MAIFIEERNMSSENLGWGRRTTKKVLTAPRGVKKPSAGLQLEAQGLTSTGPDLRSEPILSIRKTESETGKCRMNTVKRELSHEVCAVVAKAGPHCPNYYIFTLAYILGNRINAQAASGSTASYPQRTPDALSLQRAKGGLLPQLHASSLDILVAPAP